MSALVGNELMTAAAWLVIVGGGIIVTISFFGCIGAITEQKCMLVTVSHAIQYRPVFPQK